LQEDPQPAAARTTDSDDSLSLAAIQAEMAGFLPRLRAFVRLRLPAAVRARESCSDVVQSVCADLLRRPDCRFRGPAALHAWLYEAALNKIRVKARWHLAARRTPAREVGADAVDPDLAASYAAVTTPSRVAMSHELLARFERAFHALPADYREVILLARVVGLSQEETARRMQRTVPSVRNLLSRALARLAVWIDVGPERSARSP
jgi:RNA polymerase sigma factor (sigma-70 family)